MKTEQIRSLGSSSEPDAGRESGRGWAPGVAELLDHLAQELALEYVRLMEQAANAEDAAPDEPGREEE